MITKREQEEYAFTICNSISPIKRLEFCAYIRNVCGLYNRTIKEFNWFVNECVFGNFEQDDYVEKKLNGEIEGWINGFVRYCIIQYGCSDYDITKFLGLSSDINRTE